VNQLPIEIPINPRLFNIAWRGLQNNQEVFNPQEEQAKLKEKTRARLAEQVALTRQKQEELKQRQLEQLLPQVWSSKGIKDILTSRNEKLVKRYLDRQGDEWVLSINRETKEERCVLTRILIVEAYPELEKYIENKIKQSKI